VVLLSVVTELVLSEVETQPVPVAEVVDTAPGVGFKTETRLNDPAVSGLDPGLVLVGQPEGAVVGRRGDREASATAVSCDVQTDDTGVVAPRGAQLTLGNGVTGRVLAAGHRKQLAAPLTDRDLGRIVSEGGNADQAESEQRKCDFLHSNLLNNVYKRDV
jgi:hypothetical protein